MTLKLSDFGPVDGGVPLKKLLDVTPSCFGQWSSCTRPDGENCPQEGTCYQEEIEREDACNEDMAQREEG